MICLRIPDPKGAPPKKMKEQMKGSGANQIPALLDPHLLTPPPPLLLLPHLQDPVQHRLGQQTKFAPLCSTNCFGHLPIAVQELQTTAQKQTHLMTVTPRGPGAPGISIFRPRGETRREKSLHQFTKWNSELKGILERCFGQWCKRIYGWSRGFTGNQ